jgi:hypothetical protein
MQPLFEDKIDYAVKTVGMGKASTVFLYNDRLEVIDKTGASIATIPLNTITSAAYVKGGLIRLHVGSQKHYLQFYRMPYRLFGVIGIILSKSSQKGTELSRKLADLGVAIETKVI